MNLKKLLAVAAIALLPTLAIAQTSPGLTKGQVLTAGQWNALFAGKQDTLGFTPLNQAGGVMSGRLVTAAPGATVAGFNLTPGTAPGSPVDGDMWMTTAGLYVRVNGTTVGPLVDADATSFAATAPLSVTFPAGVATYACATCSVTTSPLSQFAATTSAQLLGVLSDETGSGLAVFNNSPTFITPTLGAAIGTSLALGGATLGGNALAVSGTETITSASAVAFGVGRQGATNPAFNIDASTGSSVTGLNVKAGAAAGGLALSVISSGTNENLTFNAKGSGTINIGGVSTGAVALGGAGGAVSVGAGGLTVSGGGFGSVGTTTLTSNSANCLMLGANGVTNPQLQVDCATASVATGLKVTGAAAGGGVALAAISSGTNEGISLNAKAAGAVAIASLSTGGVSINDGAGNVRLTLGSDATGDTFYRNSSGFLTRIPIGSNTQVMTVSGGLPTWQAGSSAASITVGTTAVNTGTTQNILYNNAGTLANQPLASFLTAGAGISITGTTNPTIALALNNASFQANLGNPTGTASATQVMMGIGATCKITPVYSGRVLLHIQGYLSNNTTTTQAIAQVRYGTGAAPSNGAAATGTTIGGATQSLSQPGNYQTPFNVGGVITGLSIGVQIWFDLGLSQGSGGTASAAGMSCTAIEL